MKRQCKNITPDKKGDSRGGTLLLTNRYFERKKLARFALYLERNIFQLKRLLERKAIAKDHGR